MLSLLVVIISAGSAFAASDDAALDAVNDGLDDQIMVDNFDDATVAESEENDDIETKIYAVDNLNYTTPDVIEGSAIYPIFLTTDTIIPLPVANKTVNVNFNGISEDYTTNILGLINYRLPAAPAGDYTIDMVFAGSEGYVGSSLSTSVKIYDVATQIVCLENASYARPLVMEGSCYYPIALTTDETLPIPLANRSVYVEFDGEGEVYTTNAFGIINYIIPDVVAGNYNMYITYPGDEGYIYSYATPSVEIYDVPTDIVSRGNVSYARPIVMEGLAYYPIALTTTDETLPIPLANRSVYVEFDGHGDLYTTNALGIINYILPNYTAGFHSIYMAYAGEDGYLYSDATYSVEIYDVPTKFWAFDNLTYTYSDVINHNAYYAVFFSTDVVPIPLANKTITIEFNGIGGEYTTNNLGLVFYSLFDSPVGNYTIKTFYYGEDGYAASNLTHTIEIVRAPTEIQADDVTVEYADPEGKLVATLTDDYGDPLSHANVYVSLNGEEYTLKTNNNGQIEVSTAELLPGNYTATISYKGSSKKYTSASTDVTVTVNKQSTSISAYYDDQTKELVATLTNADGKALSHANVFITIGDDEYTVKTNSKGQAVFSTEELAPSIYIANIAYKGSKIYESTDAYLAFITITTFIVAPDVSVDYGDADGKFVATLYDINGKPIKGAYLTVKLGGETYKLKTDANGRVEISTADLAPGTYTATISYKGNSKGYTPFTTTANIVVNKIDTTVSAEYNFKTCELTVTLTDADGKALKGANVVVKVDGVKYNVKINSTGQGKISFADLEPGSYVVDISYKGNVKYNPATTQTRIVIREN